jgi:hypothetical protein
MQLRDFSPFLLAATPLQEHPIALLPGASVGLAASPNLRLAAATSLATCDSGWTTCGSNCMPIGGVCCSGLGYCDADEYCTNESTCCPVGKTCSGTGTCDPGEVICGAGCMPADGICCSGNGYCDPGEFCTDHDTCCLVRIPRLRLFPLLLLVCSP